MSVQAKHTVAQNKTETHTVTVYINQYLLIINTLKVHKTRTRISHRPVSVHPQLLSLQVFTLSFSVQEIVTFCLTLCIISCNTVRCHARSWFCDYSQLLSIFSLLSNSYRTSCACWNELASAAFLIWLTSKVNELFKKWSQWFVRCFANKQNELTPNYCWHKVKQRAYTIFQL